MADLSTPVFFTPFKHLKLHFCKVGVMCDLRYVTELIVQMLTGI